MISDEQRKIFEEQTRKGDILLSNIKRERQNLEKILALTEDHWGEEDMIYRFYHGSFKVYRIQGLTEMIYDSLQKISPHKDKNILNQEYRKIIQRSRNQKQSNNICLENCGPILEAFFHSKYFLEMAVKCGKRYSRHKHIPQRVYSGWAALLELYGIR
jgi:hypothetical protein